MKFPKRLFSHIPVLICSFVAVVALTVPAFAEVQPVIIACGNCGENHTIIPNETCVYSFSCSCGSAYYKNYNSSGLYHSFSTVVRKEATCTDEGIERIECVYCPYVDLTTIPALGGDHIWTETSRTAPTSTTPGSIEYTCSTCGDTKQESIPVLEPSNPGGSTPVEGSGDFMTGFEYVVSLLEEVWDLMLSNSLMTLFLAVSLLIVGVRVFRSLKSAAKM